MTMLILAICRSLIYIYVFLVSLRVVFSWFKPVIDGTSSRNVSKLWHNLCLITGPYLAFFKGLKQFQSKVFDYTPFLAIFVLLFFAQAIGLIPLVYHVSLLKIVIVIVLAIWEAMRLMLIFFLALCVVRLIGLYFEEELLRKFLKVVDLALQPITAFTLRVSHKRLCYQTILFLCIGAIIVICIAGSFSFASLYTVLGRI
jgi:hypothetical protein